LKFDVKPEKCDCDKTGLSRITDRSHKATVTSRPVTSFGHQREERIIFWGRPKPYITSMYESSGNAYNMSMTFLEGEKVFPGGRSPPLSNGHGHQLTRYAVITL